MPQIHDGVFLDDSSPEKIDMASISKVFPFLNPNPTPKIRGRKLSLRHFFHELLDMLLIGHIFILGASDAYYARLQ